MKYWLMKNEPDDYSIDNLKKDNLDESINLFLNKGNYLLGICLGMQLLMDKSEEFGNHIGLGLIKGDVTKLNKKKNYSIYWQKL